jgi:hypothetical protein
MFGNPFVSGQEVRIMFWECSECGGRVDRRRPPALCGHCGMAGVLFVPAEMGLEADPGVPSMREAWLQAGLDYPRAALGPAGP